MLNETTLLRVVLTFMLIKNLNKREIKVHIKNSFGFRNSFVLHFIGFLTGTVNTMVLCFTAWWCVPQTICHTPITIKTKV